MAKTAFENPLMPHAKLRQIYLAMLQARLLAKHLGKSSKSSIGLEACLASTSADLAPADLVSDTAAGKVTDFLRGASIGTLLGKPATRKGLLADCGKASRLPPIATVRERLWASVGAAQAVKAAGVSAKAAGSEATQQAVVIAYLHPAEAPKPLLREVLACAAAQDLPLIFVLMPGEAAGGICVLSLKSGVPGIAVDGADAVAIYRVAQESVGRARAGGGTALIECVPFVLAGNGKPRKVDAIPALQDYLLRRGVCTQAWIDRAAASFTTRLEMESAR